MYPVPWLFNVYMDGVAPGVLPAARYSPNNNNNMDGVMKEGSELHGGWDKVEIAWPVVYR